MSEQFYRTLQHPAYRIKVPFGAWRTRAMELLQTVFTPMYKNVFEANWNNSLFACMRKPYYYCDFEQGIYEVYVPTTVDAENRMHYWRIIVKVYKELDKQLITANQLNLQTPYTKPMGVIDSETICHLAETTTPEHRKTLRELWKKGGRKEWFKGLLRGFRHIRRRGYFTLVVVHESPDIAVKRLLSLVYNFLKKRVTGFFRKLKLQTWMFEEYLSKRANSSLLMLIEKYSITIRQIMKSFLETFDWIKVKLKDLYAEIGRQNVQKAKIKPLINEIRQVITVFRRKNSLRNADIPDPPIIKRLIQCISE